MKTPNYTYRELVHHLDLYTTDPLVRKLIDYLVETDENVINGLIEVGMDPDYQTFDIAYQGYSPADYIRQLRRDCDDLEQELRIAQDDLQDMTDERDRLKTRSVAELMASMEEIVKRAKAESAESQRIARKVEQENDELKDKINVWKIMES